MIEDNIGQQLHHRSTTGEPLTDEEQVHLKEWYAAKDHQESLLLLAKPSPSLTELQTKIELAVQELIDINKKNSDQREANAALEAEIVALKRYCLAS